MVQKLHYLLTLMLVMLCTAVTAQTTVSMTSFTSVSGHVGGDANVSYKAEKGNASTPPAVNNGQIRVYQNGGLFTVSVGKGCSLNKVIIGSAMATTVTYVTDKNTTASGEKSIAVNGTLSVDLTGGEKSITFTCTGSSQSDRLYVNSLSVTYTKSGTTTKKDAGLSFSETTATAKVGESFTAPTLNNPNNLKVSYKSSVESVATVDANGAVTIKAAGTTTITASSEETDVYAAGSASYELTVTGSSDDKSTDVFSETFDKCQGTGGNDGRWSGNIASSQLTADNKGWSFTKGGGASKCAKFGSSSKGSATTPSIALTGNATLTFKAGAWAGDAKTLNVSATGATLSQSSVTLADSKFTDYSIAITNATGNVTITFAAGQSSKNRFFLDEVKVTKNSSSEDEVAVPTISGDETFLEKTTVTITAAEDCGITYTTDGTDPSSSKTATTSDKNTVSFDIIATTTVKAVAVDAKLKVSSVAKKTFTKAEPITVAKALETADNTEIIVKGVVTRVADYNSKYTNINYWIADDASGEELEIFRGTGLNNADITSQDDIARGDVVFVKGTKTTYNKTTELAAGSTLLKQTDYNASVSAAGWATYVTSRGVTFPSDVKAFAVAYDKTNDKITLNAVTSVPAKTAVVLKGNEGSYDLTRNASATAPETNNLTFSDAAKTVTTANNIYVLAQNSGVIGFWPVKENTTVAAFKGYLDLGSNSSAKSFFSLDDAVTGVSSIKAETKEDGVRYNLAGQRVDSNYKGVVIMNGKKFMVK